MDDARERAATIARGGGERTAPSRRHRGLARRAAHPACRPRPGVEGGATETPIEAGSQEIGVALSVTFELGGGK